MNPTSFIGQLVRLHIDRPLGSRHPEYGYEYPLNYGFVPGEISPDGEDLDAYVLGVRDPIATFEGECIAVIHRTNDRDDKLVVGPTGVTFTDQQIREATEFQERYFESVILRGPGLSKT